MSEEYLIKSIINETLNSFYISAAQILRKVPFIKKAINIQDLLRRTNDKSTKHKIGCNAVMTRATPKNGLWLFSVKCTEVTSKGPYQVRFKITKDQRLKDMNKRDIKVSCNCNAWKFNGADYNSLSGKYNERQYSNGANPNIRDPHHGYLICKHVAVCIPQFARFIVPEEFKGLTRREPGQITRPIRPSIKQNVPEVEEQQPTKPSTPPQKPKQAPRTRPTRPNRITPIKPIKPKKNAPPDQFK